MWAFNISARIRTPVTRVTNPAPLPTELSSHLLKSRLVLWLRKSDALSDYVDKSFEVKQKKLALKHTKPKHQRSEK